MAKISAHGESAHVTFEGKDGARVVLTKKGDLRPGRLLKKASREHGYTVVKTYPKGRRAPALFAAAFEAEDYAKERGMVKV